MKKARKLLGLFPIILFILLEIVVLMDNEFSISVENFEILFETFFNNVFNVTNGDALQILTKITIIIFAISMIVLPIMVIVVYFIRKRQNKGRISSYFFIKFLLALVGILVVIVNFGQTPNTIALILMDLFMLVSIAYFILSLIEVSKTIALINIEDLYENVEGIQEDKQASISLEDEETEEEDEFDIADGDDENNFILDGFKSFEEKFITADEQLKNNYSIIKNELMRYEKMKSRISKTCETFRISNILLAKIAIRGKKIKLYLALDPESIDFATYHQIDVSMKKKYEMTPSCFNIKSNLSVKKALQLIKFTCGQIRAHRLENYQEVDFSKQFLNKENKFPEIKEEK